MKKNDILQDTEREFKVVLFKDIPINQLEEKMNETLSLIEKYSISKKGSDIEFEIQMTEYYYQFNDISNTYDIIVLGVIRDV